MINHSCPAVCWHVKMGEW